MKKLPDILGTITLFGFYIGGAWILTKWPMSTDRALLISALMALAQLRWYQEDKSPLGKTERQP